MERVFILWNKSTGKVELIASMLAELLTYLSDYTGDNTAWKVMMYKVGANNGRTIIGADSNDTSNS